MSDDFLFRTESIPTDKILGLYVQNDIDKEVVRHFKSPSHIVLEGSRGTGKSFLMKVAQLELEQEFNTNRVLPVYITFMQSSLLQTTDTNQFNYWRPLHNHPNKPSKISQSK